MARVISEWLMEIGLGKYAETFLANDIDLEILPDLDDADLERLGVSLGHRKKLLRAIANLAAAATSAKLSDSRPRAADPSSSAERRQLTVMFVDLVGSTELTRRLDPEVMREVIRAYQDLIAGEAARFEGHIAKFMGDGVLAYFGWPQAHENSAERAVRAGLAMTGAVRRLTSLAGKPLAARVGIASGLVVVGDLIGRGAAQERTVVGDAPNLAARLQSLADPASVVIDAATRRQIGGLFDLTSIGEYFMKGFDEPIPAWRVEGESTAESRFEALHGERLTPLIGREHEVGLLLERFERAKYGEGQVVLLPGEPGIGKSRVIRSLGERLQGETYIYLSHFCSPFHANSAFYPIVRLIERMAEFRRDDTPETRLGKLDAFLTRIPDSPPEAAPLLASLLSLPRSDRYPPLTMTPEAQKQRTIEVLVDLLAELASERPVLSVFEDLHWVDPSTLGLLELVVERVQRLAVLVVITFRPEFEPPWPDRGHVTSLRLGRLARRQGTSMIEAVTGGKTLPAEVLDQIVTKTDGVPLFIEELTKSLLESGVLREVDSGYELTGPLSLPAIPATLQDSVLARFDRLGDAKDTAQLCAALGREFPYELLAAVSPLDDDALQEMLRQLTRAEMIFRRGSPPNAIYTFKHALVQDAAYGRLLKSRRQELHSRIARVMRQRFPHLIAAEPELLAHHHTEAGELEQAIENWLTAGRRAIERSANFEAVAHLRRGLKLVNEMPDDATRARRELKLQIAIGSPLLATKGYGAPEVGVTYARARELCDRVGDEAQRLPVLYGQCAYQIVQAENQAARQSSREFLREAERQGNASAILVARRVVGFTQYEQGNLIACRDSMQRVCDLYVEERDGNLGFQYGQNPLPPAMAVLAVVVWLLGDTDRASQLRADVIRLSNATGHANTRAYAQIFAGCVMGVLCQDWQSVREHGAALLTFTEQRRMPMWHAWAKFYHTLAAAAQAPTLVLAEQMQRALVETDATGAKNNLTFHLAMLAEVHGRIGQAARGLKVADDALALAEKTDERWWEAEIHRVRGELLVLLGGDRVAEAEEYFAKAIAVARSQFAKSLELRAATSMARHRQRTGGSTIR
jgi:class 3 adenylate cyclase/predicted ATPase